MNNKKIIIFIITVLSIILILILKIYSVITQKIYIFVNIFLVIIYMYILLSEIYNDIKKFEDNIKHKNKIEIRKDKLKQIFGWKLKKLKK